MRVDILAIGPPPIGYSSRKLSGILKAAGHTTRILFLPYPPHHKDTIQYSLEVLDAIASFVERSDMVCVTRSWGEMDCVEGVIQILKRLENLDIFREVGGKFAALAPHVLIPHAEAVCLGEGEIALPKLLGCLEAGNDYLDLKGFHFRTASGVVRNALQEPSEDMDGFGIPDHGPEGHFVLDGETIRPFTSEDLFVGTSPMIRISVKTMKGCPLRCSFCIETSFVETGARTYRVRKRSLPVLFNELLGLKHQYPTLEYIDFHDQDFFVRSTREIEEFSEFYKEHIGLPFCCKGTPNSISEEKLQVLVGAGLIDLDIGLQSGSDRINIEVFNRHLSRDVLDQKIKLLNTYRRLVHIRYNVIIRNRYETSNDLFETVAMLRQIKFPCYIVPHPLEFVPFGPLYASEVAEGLLTPFSSMKEYGGRGVIRYWNHTMGGYEYGLLRRDTLHRIDGSRDEMADAFDALIFALYGNWSVLRQGWLPRGSLPLLTFMIRTPLAKYLRSALYLYASAAQVFHLSLRRMHRSLLRSSTKQEKFHFFLRPWRRILLSILRY